MNLEQRLKPGDGVLDIGANVGDMSKAYAKIVGESGYVLAVEADPDTVEKCRQQTRTIPQITVHWAAVASPDHDRIGLFRDHGDCRRNSLFKANLMQDKHDPPVVVPVMTLDDLAKQVPNLRGIKIDAQGAEVEILKGGQKTLGREGISWWVEIWPEGLKHAGSSTQELADAFELYGLHPVNSTWQKVCADLKDYKGHRSHDYLIERR